MSRAAELRAKNEARRRAYEASGKSSFDKLFEKERAKKVSSGRSSKIYKSSSKISPSSLKKSRSSSSKSKSSGSNWVTSTGGGGPLPGRGPNDCKPWEGGCSHGVAGEGSGRSNLGDIDNTVSGERFTTKERATELAKASPTGTYTMYPRKSQLERERRLAEKRKSGNNNSSYRKALDQAYVKGQINQDEYTRRYSALDSNIFAPKKQKPNNREEAKERAQNLEKPTSTEYKYQNQKFLDDYVLGLGKFGTGIFSRN